MSVSSSATSSNAQTGQFGIAQTSSSSGSTITSSGSAPTVTVSRLHNSNSRHYQQWDPHHSISALDCFFAAIESTKHSNDLQWQASAMESLCCAQLLSLAIQSGACNGTRHIIFSNPCTPATHADQAVNPTDSSSGDPKSSEAPLASSTETPQTRYSDAYHERFYPIFQISACLKLASFLSQVCLRGDMILFGVNGAGVSYWNSEMRGLGAEIAARIGSSGSGGSNTGGLAHVGVGVLPLHPAWQQVWVELLEGVGQGGVLGGMIPGLASTPAGPGPMTMHRR
ncbi:hypothetical protein BASA62_001893 [Batrachochytrium salamandrivorans]|nr:hypothetical protein BASA62_001893 [Batrachochytrium salamandrivorans]